MFVNRGLVTLTDSGTVNAFRQCRHCGMTLIESDKGLEAVGTDTGLIAQLVGETCVDGGMQGIDTFVLLV